MPVFRASAKMVKLSVACLAFLQVASTATQRILKAPRLGFQERFENLDAAGASGLPNDPLFIQMPLDHFNASNRETFPNRYWVNATYYEPGGPVFLFDSGEQNAEPLLPYYLQEYHGLSAVMRSRSDTGALRFCGSTGKYHRGQWKYLNTEQALQDVVFFADSFPKTSGHAANASSGHPNALPIHPSVVPWVWLGGSYPGVMISPVLRIQVVSIPAQAQVDMSSYYKAAERSLTRNCSADWVAVTK
ncbi:hypothetical protein B0H14DRAFT_3452248 [Mycena olivaceomarginata]|nr:hypothetical protein B0H14DRAFT_3452248 [Mycena olivaceomarginata]